MGPRSPLLRHLFRMVPCWLHFNHFSLNCSGSNLIPSPNHWTKQPSQRALVKNEGFCLLPMALTARNVMIWGIHSQRSSLRFDPLDLQFQQLWIKFFRLMLASHLSTLKLMTIMPISCQLQGKRNHMNDIHYYLSHSPPWFHALIYFSGILWCFNWQVTALICFDPLFMFFISPWCLNVEWFNLFCIMVFMV